MHSVPAPAERELLKGQKPAKPDRRSRLKRLQDDDISPDWPVLLAGEMMAGWLLDAGPALPSGNGPAPLTQGEIRAWQQNTGITLTAWECQTLRLMSQAYVGELHAGEDPKHPAPYVDETKAPTARAKRARRAASSLRDSVRADAD